MHRLVAIVAAVGVLSMSASAALLHVHGSTGHEHAEHHHGPAAHSHVSLAEHHQHKTAHGDGTELEPCDPAGHVVPVAFTCVAAWQVDLPIPDACDVTVLGVPGRSTVAAAPSDVRAHSPPRLTDAPLRAPPRAPLA